MDSEYITYSIFVVRKLYFVKLSNEEAHYSQSRKYSIRKIAWDFVDHYYTLGTAFNEPVTFLSAIHFLCIEQALQVYSSK